MARRLIKFRLNAIGLLAPCGTTNFGTLIYCIISTALCQCILSFWNGSRNDRWKYIHYTGYRPQLFDLQEDPDEVRDLGESPDHAQVRETMRTKLFDRLTSRRNRVTVTDAAVEARTNGARSHGVIIGEW